MSPKKKEPQWKSAIYYIIKSLLFVLKDDRIDLSAAIGNVKNLFPTYFAQATSMLYLTECSQNFILSQAALEATWTCLYCLLLAVLLDVGDSILSKLQICRYLSFSSKAPLELLLILCPEQQTDTFTVQANGFTHLWSLPFQNSIKAVQTTWTLLKMGIMESCSYFSLQTSFRLILFILYVVQLTQVIITSDFAATAGVNSFSF